VFSEGIQNDAERIPEARRLRFSLAFGRFSSILGHLIVSFSSCLTIPLKYPIKIIDIIENQAYSRAELLVTIQQFLEAKKNPYYEREKKKEITNQSFIMWAAILS